MKRNVSQRFENKKTDRLAVKQFLEGGLKENMLMVLSV
jgi:hypothetical protein